MLPLPTPVVPPPRVRGGDDGVLHHFQHALILEDLLQPFPRVQIVLSTSWAVPNFRRARRRLTSGLAARCIGSTFHSKMDRQSFEIAFRGLQIWADMQRRKPRAWLALDDAGFGWPAWSRDRLILIRGSLADQPEAIAARFVQAFG